VVRGVQLTAVQSASESLQRVSNAMAVDAHRHRRCAVSNSDRPLHAQHLLAHIACCKGVLAAHMLMGTALCRSHQRDNRVPFTVGPVQEDPAK